MPFRVGLVTSLITCSAALAGIASLSRDFSVPSTVTTQIGPATGYTAGAEVQAAVPEKAADDSRSLMPLPAVQSQVSANQVSSDNVRHLAVVGPAQVSTAMQPKRSTLVAVLDTGIDKTHEALSGLVVGEANFSASYDTKDRNGHGTHVAGIIAAKENSAGVVGVAAGCQLLNVKVADDEGRCEPAALAEGIVWAVDHGASVINVSIELQQSSPELEKAVGYAWNNGSLIVAASGNDAEESSVYPACYDNCVAVCCLEDDDKVFSLSNCGDWVHVAAPGCNVYSCLPKNRYGYRSGTSCAAAYTSGIAALLFTSVDDTDGDGRLNDEVKALIEVGYRQVTVPVSRTN